MDEKLARFDLLRQKDESRMQMGVARPEVFASALYAEFPPFPVRRNHLFLPVRRGTWEFLLSPSRCDVYLDPAAV